MIGKVEIDYTNHRGERAVRVVKPLWLKFTSNQWHRKVQWLMIALDVERNVERSFAIKDIHRWTPVEA